MTPCILWPGSTSRGYGMFNGKLVHREIWEKVNGKIPEGKEIHHLCKNKRCINLDHFLMVTNPEHQYIDGRQNSKWTTHCIHGHEFTERNTYVDSKNRRHCRECNRLARRNWVPKKFRK